MRSISVPNGQHLLGIHTFSFTLSPPSSIQQARGRGRRDPGSTTAWWLWWIFSRAGLRRAREKRRRGGLRGERSNWKLGVSLSLAPPSIYIGVEEAWPARTIPWPGLSGGQDSHAARTLPRPGLSSWPHGPCGLAPRPIKARVLPHRPI